MQLISWEFYPLTEEIHESVWMNLDETSKGSVHTAACIYIYIVETSPVTTSKAIHSYLTSVHCITMTRNRKAACRTSLILTESQNFLSPFSRRTYFYCLSSSCEAHGVFFVPPRTE